MPSRRSLHAGDRLGRYLVQGPIGPGVLGDLYFAASGRERFELEVLAPEVAADAGFVDRVEREVKLAAKVAHPNVLGAAELVRAEGAVAIATPYRPGPAVEALYPGGALHVEITPALVAWIGAECAAGLARAHTMSTGAFVHRGISPGAIRLGLDGRVRASDFGIADAMRSLGKRSPIDPSLLAPYLAPEQIDGGPTDPRSDLWSLGVVLWELLARQRLFRRESRAETLEAIQFLEIPPLDDMREDVPLPLEDAIRRAVERQPSKRWASAKALEEALRSNLPADIGRVRAPLVAALEPAAKEERQRTASLPQLTPDPKPAAAPVPPPAPPPAIPTPPPLARAAPVPVPVPMPAPGSSPEGMPDPLPAPKPAPVVAAPPTKPAPPPPLPLPPPEPQRSVDHTPEPAPAPSRPRRTGLIAAVLGIFVFALVVGVLILVFPDDSSQTASAEPATGTSRTSAPIAQASTAQAPPPSTAAPESASPATAEAAGTTTMRLEANRMQAWAEIDGNPARVELPYEIQGLVPGTVVHVRIGAPGYLPRAADGVAGRQRRIRLWLGRPGEVEPVAGTAVGTGTDDPEDGPADPTFRPLDERPGGDIERSPFGN